MYAFTTPARLDPSAIYTHVVVLVCVLYILVVKVLPEKFQGEHSLVIDLPSHPLRSIYHEYEWAGTYVCADACVLWTGVWRRADSVISLPSSALFWVIPFSGHTGCRATEETRNFQLVIYDSVARAFCMQLSSCAALHKRARTHTHVRFHVGGFLSK